MKLIITSTSLLQSLMLCCVVLLGGSCATAVAQQASLPYAAAYRTVEVDENARNRKELSTRNRNAKNAVRDGKKKVQEALLAGGNLSTPETQDFFEGYLWPSMTQPLNLTDTGSLRDDFKKDFLTAKFPAASRRSFIESIAIPGLQKIIDSDLAPAARVNALVLLGQLDEAPFNRSTKSPPTPSLTAFQALGKAWQGDYPDYLKAVAFSGLNRHITIDLAHTTPRIPNGQKSSLMKAVASQMDAILKADPTLENDLGRWQVGKSIEMLSASGLTGEAENFATRFVALLAEGSQVPKWTKLKAIRALNRLSLQGVAAAKINSMIEASVSYLGNELTTEADTIQTAVDTLIYDNILWQNVDLEVTGTDYGSDAKMMGMGMSDGMEDDSMFSTAARSRPGETVKPMVDLPNFELNLARRRIKLLGFTVQQFLQKDAVQNGASAKNRNRIDDLNKVLNQLLNEDSDVGLVDISKGSDTKGSDTRGSDTRGSSTRGATEDSIAMQLKKACLIASTEVNRILDDGAPAAPGAAPARGGTQPTEESSDQPF